MNSFRAPVNKTVIRAAVVLGASLLPYNVLAADVTLKSSDGRVNLVGEFVDFVDDTYIIKTGLGELRIARSDFSCEGEACPTINAPVADVKFAGSDTIGLGVMPLLISGYASYLDAEAKITPTGQKDGILANFIGDGGFGDELGSYLVESTTSGSAFSTLLDGTADIGMSSRRITPKEARSLKAAGAGNMVNPAQENIVAVDSLVVIVNPANTIQELHMDQLRDIYAGKITNWSELGGEDLPITMISRQADSGTRSVFESSLFEQAQPALSDAALIASSNTEMSNMVNAQSGAIGFVGYAFQRGAKALPLINECGISTSPDEFSAKTEEYAFQRRLYLYNRGDTLEDKASDFLDYAMSSNADAVIAKAGFIDLGVTLKEQPLNGPRAMALLDPNVDAFEGGVMREMLSQMINYDRLSTTFRFKTGSSRLDQRGELDMVRLATYLEGKPEGTKVMFVGFTDSVGAFQSNRNLSISRASRVLDVLTDAAGDRLQDIEMSHAGFGEIVPSACNTTENGRSINRRVEVWVSKPAS